MEVRVLFGEPCFFTRKENSFIYFSVDLNNHPNQPRNTPYFVLQLFLCFWAKVDFWTWT